MALPLHTGLRTCTVSTEWSAWDIRGRLVVTDPWMLRRARQVLEEQLTALDRAAHPFGRRGRGAAPVDGPGQLGPAGSAAAVRPFPYGLAVVPEGGEVHQPAPEAGSPARSAGLLLEPGLSMRARAAQLCAERVAEATACGALVALGGIVATSGLAPAGGWRVELGDGVHMVVALDGGAISRISTVRSGQQRGGPGLHRIVVPATGRTAAPAWRSVTVVGADAPSANAASVGALLRGTTAAAWLAELGVPARLVDTTGAVWSVGRWPAHASS